MKTENINGLNICGDCKLKLATHPAQDHILRYNLESNNNILGGGTTDVNLCCDCFTNFINESGDEK